jgi:hypothetical protein
VHWFQSTLRPLRKTIYRTPKVCTFGIAAICPEITQTPAAPVVIVVDTIFISEKLLKLDAGKLIIIPVDELILYDAALAESKFSICKLIAIALNSVGNVTVLVVAAGIVIKIGKDSTLVSFGFVRISNP